MDVDIQDLGAVVPLRRRTSVPLSLGVDYLENTPAPLSLRGVELLCRCHLVSIIVNKLPGRCPFAI